MKKVMIMLLILFAFVMTGCKHDKIGAPESAKVCEKKDYKDVKDIFSKAGFTNIELRTEDIGMRIFAKENTVKSIQIGINDDFKKNDAFFPDEKVVITYWQKKKK